MSVHEPVFVSGSVCVLAAGAPEHAYPYVPGSKTERGRESSLCDFKGIFSPRCLAGQEKLALTVDLGACQVANRDEKGSVLIW